jgi:ABC-type sulfate transport system permease component
VIWYTEPGLAVAWAQLIFNIVISLAVLLVLRIFQRRLEAFEMAE